MERNVHILMTLCLSVFRHHSLFYCGSPVQLCASKWSSGVRHYWCFLIIVSPYQALKSRRCMAVCIGWTSCIHSHRVVHTHTSTHTHTQMPHDTHTHTHTDAHTHTHTHTHRCPQTHTHT